MLFGRTDRYPSGVATHPLSREDVYTDLRSAHNTHQYGVFVYTPLFTRWYAVYLGTVLLFHVPCTEHTQHVPCAVTLLHVPCSMLLCTEHTQHTQHVPCSSSFVQLLCYATYSMFHVPYTVLLFTQHTSVRLFTRSHHEHVRESPRGNRAIRRPHRFRLNFRTNCPFS